MKVMHDMTRHGRITDEGIVVLLFVCLFVAQCIQVKCNAFG